MTLKTDSASRHAWLRQTQALLPVFSLAALDLVLEKRSALYQHRPETLAANFQVLGKGLGITQLQLARMVQGNPQLLSQSPATIIRNWVELRRILSVEPVRLNRVLAEAPTILVLSSPSIRLKLNAIAMLLAVPDAAPIVVRSPTLLHFAPDTLAAHLSALAGLPGCSPTLAVTLARRRPELLRLSTATLLRNISALAELLRVDAADILRIARFHPQLLYQRIETLRSNLEGSAEALGLNSSRLSLMALRQPHILFQKPASVRERVVELARLFEVPFEDMVAAAVPQPHLLSRSPASLHRNAVTATKMLGVDFADFRRIVLKAPTLLGRKPESLKRKAPYIRRIGRALGLHKTLTELVSQCPTALSYSTDRLLLRYLAVRFGLLDVGFNKVITMSPALVSAKLLEHLQASPNLTGLHAALVRRKLLP